MRRNAKGEVTAWREPDGILYAHDAKGEKRAVVFSISSGISEKFSLHIDQKLVTHNEDLADDDKVTRAEWIRQIVAEAVDYDLTQEPPREPKGAGLKEYREKVAQKVSGFDTVAKMAAADPELAARLREAGIQLPES